MQGPAVVIIDLADVGFMASAGLNLLVNAHRLYPWLTAALLGQRPT
jgi:hypothetical protein